MIREVLSGQAGPARDIVVLNTAAALWTANQSSSLADAAQLAAQAIDSGDAANLLKRLSVLSHADPASD